jgi:hypothetical protein
MSKTRLLKSGKNFPKRLAWWIWLSEGGKFLVDIVQRGRHIHLTAATMQGAELLVKEHSDE